ncbi:MAG: hypothetical protein EOO81_07305 [Oxalobacteraceae bacterium]|nr:MAG: hypothetical protein EOO81_07305 [Oxalobacteraceae bacterium]
MREDRLDWAAGLERHAERMFKETGNPYYVVAAIAAARTAEWQSPKWAVDALTKAVADAWWVSEMPGGELSVDRALGLRTKRGGTPPKRAAEKSSIEDGVFALVKTIHTCFELSVPTACEIVYRAIDYEYAKGAEEWLPPPGEPNYSDHDLERIGLTRSELAEIRVREKSSTAKIIEKDKNTDAVKSKLYQYKHWTITHGDRLGYSLDKLIDRYYREGGKRIVPHGKVSERDMLFYDGAFLLLIGYRCTHKVDIVRGEDDPIQCQSAVANLPFRPDFKQWRDRIPLFSVVK